MNSYTRYICNNTHEEHDCEPNWDLLRKEQPKSQPYVPPKPMPKFDPNKTIGPYTDDGSWKGR